MPLQLRASVLLSPLHPFAFFSLLGGHLTLSSCALVLGPLHRESLQDSPSLAWLHLHCLGFALCSLLPPFIFHATLFHRSTKPSLLGYPHGSDSVLSLMLPRWA